MRRIQQPANRGSQYWLQKLVNERPSLLDDEIAEHLVKDSGNISWLSPIREDEYSEYSDAAFLELLQVPIQRSVLASFWPPRGPVWDGLGKSASGDFFLVEAKAHVAELVSRATEAKEPSLTKIKSSLEAAKAFIGAKPEIDWTTSFYQYTNRLAHLYFLRQLNNVPAYLVLIYFIGDDDMNGPKSKDEWSSAILLQESFLGVRRHRLSDYIIHAFFDVGDIQATISPTTN